MRLNTFTDYCLRVLMYCALTGGRLATISEISAAYGISASHLTKVVFFLGQQGYLETVRGKGGGMRLRPKPEQVDLGRLARIAETDNALVECFDPDNASCRIAPACQLRAILRAAQEAFYAELSRHTLADLTASPQPLVEFLGVPILPSPTKTRRGAAHENRGRG
ncbi:BadM/Rrf2 family transcriptional regulator [Chromobacterium phragmitis]|nr:Rrf2 family transcriptional regulator [Chromobacterium phragmitis]AXE31662.1 BadM/Rrf2 family transcriptional regulator [Chromobacterium phragmitis]AXE32989.1 BadM/Rrf2 family transcriptional regulator [Chromobacterium phragmitis]